MSRPHATLSSDVSIRPVSVSAAFRKSPPPIIVIGMHRSGTSMVAGMLSVMGLFLDPALPRGADDIGSASRDAQMRTNGYGESTAFRLLNESILSGAGANWYDVEPLLRLRDSPVFGRASVARMQLATYGTLLRDHLLHRQDGAPGAWGWKDPRTSLLIPYWLRLFPEARLLHVRRQDDSIVNSLVRRATQQAAEPAAAPGAARRASRWMRSPLLAVNGIARRLSRVPQSTVGASALQSRDFCYELTNRYVKECLTYRALGERYLEVWYEDVLADPAGTAVRLSEFAGIRPDSSALAVARDMVARESTPALARNTDAGRQQLA